MNSAVLVTGGFDPLHSGHINYFNNAKKLGDKLIVGLNSDDWLTRKKGQPFMNLENRASIIVELRYIHILLCCYETQWKELKFVKKRKNRYE